MSGADYTFPLGLFDACGVEMEYMIVDRDTLDVRPACDALFRAATGHDTSEVSGADAGSPEGVVEWSNELALHVVELKTAGPAPALAPLAAPFQRGVERVNALLEPLNARLLPGGMHPWMDPLRETKLWTHEYTEVYAAYDRIFGCRGHGWSNLQSTHLNLPFANDDEFGRLYAALRLVLPLLPALAASTPFVDGGPSPFADHRMEVYRTNSARVPRMAGLVVPEPTFTRAAFERDVLGRLYDDLAPLDPDGVLREPFANSRGAMARFDRGAVEIRVLDLQECPAADLAVAALVVAVARALTQERWTGLAEQQAAATEPLAAALRATSRDAELTVLTEPVLLRAFGVTGASIPAGELWRKLLDEVLPADPDWSDTLGRRLAAGTLSTRLRDAAGPEPDRGVLSEVYGELAICLEQGSAFRVG